MSGKCKAQTRKNRRKPKCTRFTKRTTRSLTAAAGKNMLSLGKLKAGSYRLTILATDLHRVVGKPVKVNFKVKPKAVAKRRRK